MGSDGFQWILMSLDSLVWVKFGLDEIGSDRFFLGSFASDEGVSITISSSFVSLFSKFC